LSRLRADGGRFSDPNESTSEGADYEPRGPKIAVRQAGGKNAS
jgi:hypothetical protein